MKKVIRLTESDLIKLVNKILVEEDVFGNLGNTSSNSTSSNSITPEEESQIKKIIIDELKKVKIVKESKKKLSQTNKTRLSKLSAEEKTARMKNSCSSPKSWTESRRNKISQALLGITRSQETREKISKYQATKTVEQNLKCGDSNRGKTWKLVDGKRVWQFKEK